MHDFVDDLTRGNVTEVKVILASVVLALAFYQVLFDRSWVWQGEAAVSHRWDRLVETTAHVIVAIAATIAIVTAKFGPTSAAEREIQEERL